MHRIYIKLWYQSIPDDECSNILWELQKIFLSVHVIATDLPRKSYYGCGCVMELPSSVNVCKIIQNYKIIQLENPEDPTKIFRHCMETGPKYLILKHIFSQTDLQLFIFLDLGCRDDGHRRS
jgi:hypothetical protein